MKSNLSTDFRWRAALLPTEPPFASAFSSSPLKKRGWLTHSCSSLHSTSSINTLTAAAAAADDTRPCSRWRVTITARRAGRLAKEASKLVCFLVSIVSLGRRNCRRTETGGSCCPLLSVRRGTKLSWKTTRRWGRRSALLRRAQEHKSVRTTPVLPSLVSIVYGDERGDTNFVVCLQLPYDTPMWVGQENPKGFPPVSLLKDATPPPLPFSFFFSASNLFSWYTQEYIKIDGPFGPQRKSYWRDSFPWDIVIFFSVLQAEEGWK